MSSRPGLRFILWAACALAWIRFPPDTLAQQRQQGLAASVVRPVHPILIRNQHGPLLRMIIDVAPGQAARLASMEFSLDGTDDLNDIEAVQLFGTGNQETFSPATPIGEAAAPARAITMLVDRPLSEGRNVFWLSCRLKDIADLRHHVTATCKSIATSLGDIVPQEDVANAKQRIGVALRKHNDDGVHNYRIPALTTSAKGTLLADYDIRRRAGRDLQEDIDIGLSRSTDGGRTWESPRVIMDMGTYGELPQEQNGCSDPGIIVDQQSGEIFCFALWMNGKPGHHQWVDDGSEPGFEIGSRHSS
jgi:sialidase-1